MPDTAGLVKRKSAAVGKIFREGNRPAEYQQEKLVAKGVASKPVREGAVSVLPSARDRLRVAGQRVVARAERRAEQDVEADPAVAAADGELRGRGGQAAPLA